MKRRRDSDGAFFGQDWEAGTQVLYPCGFDRSDISRLRFRREDASG